MLAFHSDDPSSPQADDNEKQSKKEAGTDRNIDLSSLLSTNKYFQKSITSSVLAFLYFRRSSNAIYLFDKFVIKINDQSR